MIDPSSSEEESEEEHRHHHKHHHRHEEGEEGRNSHHRENRSDSHHHSHHRHEEHSGGLEVPASNASLPRYSISHYNLFYIGTFSLTYFDYLHKYSNVLVLRQYKYISKVLSSRMVCFGWKVLSQIYFCHNDKWSGKIGQKDLDHQNYRPLS